MRFLTASSAWIFYCRPRGIGEPRASERMEVHISAFPCPLQHPPTCQANTVPSRGPRTSVRPRGENWPSVSCS